MQPIRILLVDDLPGVCRDLTVTLGLAARQRQLDLQVVGEAADGLQALRLVDELKPDVVLMDLEMPVMDGLEATRRIKASHPDVRIIILTIHNGPDIQALVESSRADAFLVKGCGHQALLDAITQNAGSDNPYKKNDE